MSDRGLNPAGLVAHLEAKRHALHDEGLQLLARAGITGAAVPAGFDGERLMAALEEEREWFQQWVGQEEPAATAEQRNLAADVFNQAQQLSDTLRRVLGIPAGASALMQPDVGQAATNAPVADVLRRALARSAPAALPRNNASRRGAQKDAGPGTVSLSGLLHQLETLLAAKPAVELPLPLEGETLGMMHGEGWGPLDGERRVKPGLMKPAAGDATMLRILVAHRLPNLYCSFMSKVCTPYLNGATEQPSPSLEFLVEAAKICGVSDATPASVMDHVKKHRKDLKHRTQGLGSAP